MRRVVVTGLGVVSSIGNNAGEVRASLKEGASGVVAAPSYAERNFRCQVEGALKINIEEALDRKTRRFMGDAAAYAYISMDQAIKDAGLEESHIINPRTGLIVGSGGPSTKAIVRAPRTSPMKRAREKLALLKFPKPCRALVRRFYRRSSASRVGITQSVRLARRRRTASATRQSLSNGASRTSCLQAAAKNLIGRFPAFSTPWAP